MRMRAAVLEEFGEPLEVQELELRDPKEGEVLVRLVACGVCHTDLYTASGVDPSGYAPTVLGHEGAGIIEEVGPGVTRVKVGDHVVCSFIPNCGSCRYCATGRQSICDMGATILEGYLPGERFPNTGKRGDYGAMCMLGTFSQYGVIHQNSCVKVDDDLPLECVALGPLPDEGRFRRLGPALEHHEIFPARSNIEFAEVEAPDRVRILIWERGVGPTMSSGTGSCASLIAAAAFGGAARDAQVVAPGGTQRVEWRDEGLFLTGWAEVIADARWLAGERF